MSDTNSSKAKNQFHLNIKSIKTGVNSDDDDKKREVQTVNIELLGINGSNAKKAGYYLACWQAEEPKRGEKPYDVIQIDQDDTSWNKTFGDLNLGKYEYTFVLGLGFESYKDEVLKVQDDRWYWPVSVIANTTENKRIDSTNGAKISIITQDRSSLIVQCDAPNGNVPRAFPQYVILAEGSISDFDVMPKLSVTPIEAYQRNMTIPSNLRKGFNIGTTYVVAFVMGGEGDSPDYKRVVGSTEFVAGQG